MPAIVIHGCHNGLGVSIASPLWKFAWWLLVKLKLAQGEAFMPISSHGPLGLESEVCTVFSNKVLPSTSGEQPKSIVIVCNILAVSYTILTN